MRRSAAWSNRFSHMSGEASVNHLGARATLAAVTGPRPAKKGSRSSELGSRVVDPGFTPSVRDLDVLVDLLADDERAVAVERAIARAGPVAFPTLVSRLRDAAPPVRGRIVRTLGRLAQAGHTESRDLLLAALEDADPKSRRNAAIALGHAGGDGVEEALLRAWERDARPEMRRSIAASLGKVGGERALELLRAAATAGPSDDPQLGPIARRAALMAARTASRPEVTAVRMDLSRSPPSPVAAVASARAGLEGWLKEELGAITAVRDVRILAPGRVGFSLVGPPVELFAARTMLSFGFPLAVERVGPGEQLGPVVARALASAEAQRIVIAWTLGDPRYRLAWADGAHHRAATWAAVEAVGRLAPHLVNDPTDSTWEVLVDVRGPAVDVTLVPRAFDDPRFTWRRADVPAASHPTVAAALARASGVEPADVVWDPFVGSGSELVERARLGPYRMLLGTDRDPRALEAARRNLAAAGVTAQLTLADALDFGPGDVTLVVTNPPMGRRASRTPSLAETLDRFVAHAASVLRPGGRLVWIAPWPARARAAGRAAAMSLDLAQEVDMGGFSAEVQRWSKS
jgi:predicted RNA methylase